MPKADLAKPLFSAKDHFKSPSAVLAGLFYATLSSGQSYAEPAPDSMEISASQTSATSTPYNLVVTENALNTGGNTFDIKTYTLGDEGGLLGPLLSRHGISNRYLLTTLLPALRDSGVDPNRLSTSQRIRFHNDSHGKPVYIEFPSNEDGLKSVLYDFRNSRAQEITKNHHFLHDFIEGRINSSFYETLAEQDAPDQLIRQLIHIYSWDVNWARDMRRGDTISVLFSYPVRNEDNTPLLDQPEVTYSKLTVKGEPVELFLFKNEEGTPKYYKHDGTSIEGPLLRTPIDGARLSSHFNPRRLHPVHKYRRPHNGTDFAAPVGTPIYAGGDGTIAFMGWKGPNGRLMRIQHGGNYMTGYAHMSGFKSGLEKGDQVRQGDIIGYVGQTGTATGPHLHYAIKQHGRWVDPMTVEMPEGDKLSGEALESFRAQQSEIKEKLEQYCPCF